MSQSEDDDGGLIRTVTKPYRSRPDDEMSLMGMLLGAGMIMIMIPLAPFMLLIWVLSKLGGGVDREEGGAGPGPS
ncbi:MAG: hypothetical protein SVG88_02620 [Halobacteriales archaeon]|nr:hypothetical protein [Halobacteriales archaeon]